MRYKTSSECKLAGVTYHLAPEAVWKEQSDTATYLPESFDREGFIHCTDGLDELMAVANRYYTADTRPFLVLILQVDKIQSPVRYDDLSAIFPHIHGPLNTNAVIGVIPVQRDEDGTFVSFSKP